MNDPLGLYEGSGGADPLGLFDSEDTMAKIPGGYVKHERAPDYSLKEKAVGGLEAAYGAAKGAIGGLVAPVTGLLMGAAGKGDAEQAANKAMEEWAYQPKTGAGQDYLHNVGEVVNRYGIPMAGVHIPTARLPKELRGKRVEESPAQKLDRIEPEADPLGLYKNEQLELPLENNVQQVRDMQMRENPQMDLFAQESRQEAGMRPVDASGAEGIADMQQAAKQAELQQINSRQAAAQAALEARQAALEQDVARQSGLDRNAALRQRMMNAEVPGLEEAQARALEESIARTQELNNRGQQMGIVEDFGNNDPMARMPEMRVDENGIPIRADLSMEAQNLENPLQRNLWGDELGPALDQARSLTEAMDNMPPWEDVQGYFNKTLTAQKEFLDAIQEANRQADGSGAINLGRGKGRSQSGGIDFDAFAKAVEGVGHKIGQFFTKNPDKFDLPKTPQDAIRNMPGLKQATQDWVPKPPTFDELRSKILGEKDGPSLIKGIQSGGINTAAKVRSSLIEGIARQNLYADKVADRTIRNQIQPLETQFRRLPLSERKAVAELLKREMFAEQRYTPEQIKEVFGEKAVQAYNAIREQFDLALQNLNEGRAARGKSPITPKEAYLASRWYGDWHVPLYDKEGKLVWYIREKSRGSASKAVEWLKKNNPEGIDWKRSEVTHRASNLDPNSPRDMASAYKEFLDMLPKDDARVQTMKELYEQMQQSDAYDFMNTKKHFLQKGNAHGFLGDKPWKSDKQNANELLTSQFQYLKEAHRWAETQKVVENIKQFLADPEINAAQPNNVAYAHAYMQNALGQGVNRAVASLESQLLKALGGSRSQAYNAVNAAKSVFYLSALGLSPGYMIMNTLQPLLSFGSHRLMSTEGLNHSAVKTTTLAFSDMAAGMAKHMTTEFTGYKPELPMSKIGKEALKYAEENGMISHNIFDENESLSQNRGVAMAQAGLGWTIALPEKVGRLGTFMSFVHHLEQSGKFANKAELFQKAEDLTNEVMVDFRRSERPMMFNQMGLVGENIVPLKSFVFSYFNQLSKFARMAKEGTPTPLLAFLGAQFIMGGVNNLPGMNEMEGMWNQVKNIFAKTSPRGYAAIKDIPGPREAIASNMPDILTYGPLSTTTGLNMYGRASTAIMDPERPFADMFPLGSLGNVVGDLAKGNGTQAAWDIAPPLGKGLMETNMDSFKVRNLETGEQLKDSQGNRKYLKASDIASGQAQGPARSESQDVKRAFGMRDFKEAKERDINYSTDRAASRDKQARDTAMNQAFNALVSGDKEQAQALLSLYANELQGAESLEKDFNDKLYSYTMTPQERLMLKRMSVPILEKVKKRQVLLGDK